MLAVSDWLRASEGTAASMTSLLDNAAVIRVLVRNLLDRRSLFDRCDGGGVNRHHRLLVHDVVRPIPNPIAHSPYVVLYRRSISPDMSRSCDSSR